MKWNFSHELRQDEFKNHEDLTLSYLLFTNEEITKEQINFETFREVEFKRCKLDHVTFDNNFLGKVKF